ncbi:hypothetical protein B9G55_01320 [Saccharibacillus sp. O16]|nr:hypothetical protein B9G55_01320 [Saccharibacillus sp. O16]
MIGETPLTRSMMSEEIWTLLDTDPEAFKIAAKEYFSRSYLGWTIVRVKYPIVFSRDDRNKQV